MQLLTFYRKLLETYGPQGWWPINGKYHPNDFSFPKNKRQQYEICVGAILTQNIGSGFFF
jgi:endonuclease-3 related protein